MLENVKRIQRVIFYMYRRRECLNLDCGSRFGSEEHYARYYKMTRREVT